MKTLLLMRHAKSSWKDPGIADHERPLNDRGQRDAPRMGRLLDEKGLVPDLILSSTAVRARRTAEIVAENCGYDGELALNADIYDSGVETLVGVISKIADKAARPLLVGHNPGLEELLFALTRAEEHLSTAAIARIALPIDTWRELRLPINGTLESVWRPKELS